MLGILIHIQFLGGREFLKSYAPLEETYWISIGDDQYKEVSRFGEELKNGRTATLDLTREPEDGYLTPVTFNV